MNRTVFTIWLVVTVVWVGLIATFAWQSWPHLPLDVSHQDPATRAAFDQAVMGHVVKNALVAILPPAAMWAMAYFVSR